MTRYFDDGQVTLWHGHVLDVLRELPSESVQCCVTSPPYWAIRAYGTEPQVWGGDRDCQHAFSEYIRPVQTGGTAHALAYVENQMIKTSAAALCSSCGAWRGELGHEPTPQMFVAHLVEVFREVRRVLKSDGVCFVNLGDSYSGSGKGPSNSLQRPASSLNNGQLAAGAAPTEWIPVPPGTKPKDLVLIPERFALAMQDDGWYVRSRIAWCKRAPMPESVRDRPTNAWEHIWMLTKSARYYWDADAVREQDAGYTSGNGFAGRQGGARETAVSGGIGTVERFKPGTGRNLWNYWLLSPDPEPMQKGTSRLVRVDADAAGDDTIRTESPDCPVHAGQWHQGANARSDEPLDASVSHIESNGADHALEPHGELVSTLPIHEMDSSLGSLDSPPLLCAETATQHSNGNHKTALDPETSQPCTPSVRSPDRTGHSEASPASFDSVDRMPESSNEMDDSPAHPSEDTPDRTADKSSCTCLYHKRVTSSVSHFATFPREIPRRCIAAATSEKGECPQCGKSWVRVVERDNPRLSDEYQERMKTPKDKAGRGVRNDYGESARSGLARPGWREFPDAKAQTTGWKPQCACGLDPAPQTVLDPFVGSGTTTMVARSMLRRSIGIDLNETYLREIALRKNAQMALMAEPA